MHAITSCIAAIDAGRQALFTSHSTQNPYPPEFAAFMPVAESPVQKAVRKLCEVRRKMKVIRRSTLKKVARLVESANPITRRSRAAAAQRLAELISLYEAACLVAFKEESEKYRLALKESMMCHWTPEHFEEVFPPSLKFISDKWAKETSDRIWNELVSASERK